MVTLITLALCEKDGRVGVTGLEIVGDSTVDGVAGLGISLEFMTTFDDDSPGGCSGCFEEEVECPSAIASGVEIVESSEDELASFGLLTLSLCARMAILVRSSLVQS